MKSGPAMHASERELVVQVEHFRPIFTRGGDERVIMMTDRADPARAELLTVLDRIPEGRGVFLGETHDLLCVAVSNKVGLLMCSKCWHTVSNPRAMSAENESRRLAGDFLGLPLFPLFGEKPVGLGCALTSFTQLR